MGVLDGIVTFTNNEYRICEVDGKKALFHRWNEHCDVIEPSPMIGGTPGGQIKFITGIIEFEDGSIQEVYPVKIKFRDNKISEFTFADEKGESESKKWAEFGKGVAEGVHHGMNGEYIDLDYVYFILYDSVEAKSKNGWCVSEKHKIIDRSERGFFTGSEEDFSNNANFTPWEDVGLQVFYEEQEAWEMCEKMAGMGLGFKDGFEWLESRRDK